MAGRLREVTREFARGEVPLAALRDAARAERIDLTLADALIKLIREWEHSPHVNQVWARNELRDRAEALLPSIPAPSSKPKDYTSAMYEAGLRGNLRRER